MVHHLLQWGRRSDGNVAAAIALGVLMGLAFALGVLVGIATK